MAASFTASESPISTTAENASWSEQGFWGVRGRSVRGVRTPVVAAHMRAAISSRRSPRSSRRVGKVRPSATASQSPANARARPTTFRALRGSSGGDRWAPTATKNGAADSKIDLWGGERRARQGEKDDRAGEEQPDPDPVAQASVAVEQAEAPDPAPRHQEQRRHEGAEPRAEDWGDPGVADLDGDLVHPPRRAAGHEDPHGHGVQVLAAHRRPRIMKAVPPQEMSARAVRTTHRASQFPFQYTRSTLSSRVGVFSLRANTRNGPAWRGDEKRGVGSTNGRGPRSSASATTVEIPSRSARGSKTAGVSVSRGRPNRVLPSSCSTRRVMGRFSAAPV